MEPARARARGRWRSYLGACCFWDMLDSVSASPVRVLGRYALYGEIAAGGMATVHFGRLLGQVGFSRTVAIKRLHPQFAKDPEFVSMFLDEARIAARVRHPNVVPTIDVVATEGELFLVMDYVHRARVRRGSSALPNSSASGRRRRIVVAILVGVLHGSRTPRTRRRTNGRRAARARAPRRPRRTTSLVGIDGIARVLDFGVAKAAGRLQTTSEGGSRARSPTWRRSSSRASSRGRPTPTRPAS